MICRPVGRSVAQRPPTGVRWLHDRAIAYSKSMNRHWRCERSARARRVSAARAGSRRRRVKLGRGRHRVLVKLGKHRRRLDLSNTALASGWTPARFFARCRPAPFRKAPGHGLGDEPSQACLGARAGGVSRAHRTRRSRGTNGRRTMRSVCEKGAERCVPAAPGGALRRSE